MIVLAQEFVQRGDERLLRLVVDPVRCTGKADQLVPAQARQAIRGWNGYPAFFAIGQQGGAGDGVQHLVEVEPMRILGRSEAARIVELPAQALTGFGNQTMSGEVGDDRQRDGGVLLRHALLRIGFGRVVTRLTRAARLPAFDPGAEASRVRGGLAPLLTGDRQLDTLYDAEGYTFSG